MAKLRITQIEIDDAGVGASELIRSALTGAVATSASTAAPPSDLPRLAAPDPAPAAVSTRKVSGRKTKHPDTPQVAADVRAVSVQSVILGALRKRPASSLELIETLKLENQQVYGTCSLLKKKGLIKSEIDEEGDGTRRWHLAD